MQHQVEITGQPWTSVHIKKTPFLSACLQGLLCKVHQWTLAEEEVVQGLCASVCVSRAMKLSLITHELPAVHLKERTSQENISVLSGNCAFPAGFHSEMKD